jgi:hypothetical protein
LSYLLLINCSYKETSDAIDLNRIKAKATEAKEFCRKNRLDTTFCILIDMNRHSGLNRFYVWGFKENKVVKQSLVSHGCCNSIWSLDFTKANPTFSNQDGSHCSSLGKFRIGKRGWSNWGIHVNYLLHGLEASNRNALQRQIVLHSWEKVTDAEIHPLGTAEGWGCPAVSNNFMKEIDVMLKDEQDKVLMWIFK